MSVGVLGLANLVAVAFGSWAVLILGSLQGRGITIAYLGRCLDLDYFIIGFVLLRAVDLEVDLLISLVAIGLTQVEYRPFKISLSALLCRALFRWWQANFPKWSANRSENSFPA